MDHQTKKQRTLTRYEQIRILLARRRYDRFGKVFVCILLVCSIGLLVATPRAPATIAELQCWALAVCGLLITGIVAAIMTSIVLAQTIIEELERMRLTIIGQPGVGGDDPPSDKSTGPAQ